MVFLWFSYVSHAFPTDPTPSALESKGYCRAQGTQETQETPQRSMRGTRGWEIHNALYQTLM